MAEAKPETFDEFMNRMLAVFPEAIIGTVDKQLIIYTNLKYEDGQVVRFEE